MIVYFDTSAFVPLLIDEPLSASFGKLWSDATTTVGTRLLFVETSSALARARRLGRISAAVLVAALDRRDELWSQTLVLDLTDDLMFRSSELAQSHSLRGYDAVHCAAAESINDDDLVAASADAQLLGAWHDLRLTTFSGTI
jgi:predicted nucleic acid-binding protein